MSTYDATVKFIRDHENARRSERGEPAITDRQLANLLFAMKHFDAAEHVLRQCEEAA